MRRYPARRPKDYRWAPSRAEGALAGGTVLSDIVCNPSNAIISGVRQTVNLQRVIGTATLSVQNTDLLDISTELYTRCSWVLLKVDADDVASYDPESTNTMENECVLAFGETPFFGYGTTQSLLVAGGGVVLAQTAVCLAYTQIHLDLRTNRKIDVNNEVVKLFVTRPSFNEIDTDSLDLSYESSWRTLLKVPS